MSTTKVTNTPPYTTATMSKWPPKSVKLTNFTKIYSLTNEKKYDIENLTLRHLIFKKLVAWSCNGSSVAPLTDYINNPVYQELIDKDNYFDVTNDERIDLDLRASSG